MFLTDLVVLAEDTAQGTAGKEDGSAAGKTADARLFPVVKCGACGEDSCRGSAVSGLRAAVDFALARAETAG